MVEKFTHAVSKGYEFAIENPEEAADILIDAVPDLDPELVKKSQKWLADKYQDDADRWGEQKLEVWEDYAEWMLEHDLLDKKLDSNKHLQMSFYQNKGVGKMANALVSIQIIPKTKKTGKT